MIESHQRFAEALAALIDEHWPQISPTLTGVEPDELSIDDLTDIQEMGPTYPSCWVLVVGASSIGNPDAVAVTTRFTPRSQLPFTGIGLLTDALEFWKGR